MESHTYKLVHKLLCLSLTCLIVKPKLGYFIALISRKIESFFICIIYKSNKFSMKKEKRNRETYQKHLLTKINTIFLNHLIARKSRFFRLLKK